MKSSGLKDKNSKEIFIGDKVMFHGEESDVVINDFSKQVVVDNDLGQDLLINLHYKCEVVDS